MGTVPLERAWQENSSRFKEDHFDISETPCSGRPSGFDEDHLNILIHNDQHQCTQELANVMNCDHSTIVQHLHAMGKVQKSGIWVLHALSQIHKNQWVAICAPLLVCHRLACEQHWPFLSCIVTGDEKWCIYANIRKRKEWLSPNKRRICQKMFQFLHLVLHFLASMAPLTILKWQNFNM